MKVDCPLKEAFRCEPDRLTRSELRICRSCPIGRMLLRRDDDHADGPGMGLLLRDAQKDPDLTTEGRSYGIPIIGAVPSCLNLRMREPAFEPVDLQGEYI